VRAEQLCEINGMRLAAIESVAENAWVLAQAKSITTPRSFEYFWIGGSSQGHPGDWRWPNDIKFWTGLSNGTPEKGVYFNWGTGKPDNGLSEWCAIMAEQGWDDETCEGERPYVCEAY